MYDPIKEYEEEIIMKDLIFFHGTSNKSNISIGSKLLPPIETGILRETFRKDRVNDNKVYLTTSLISAITYAKKAISIFGGDPIILICKPDEETIHCRIDNEFITDFAEIIAIKEIENI